MPLTIVPTLSEVDREKFESRLDVIRARRTELAVAYHAGRQAKLAHEADTIQRKFEKTIDMLEKDLIKLDKQIMAAEDRLAKLIAMSSELGLVTDLIELRTSDHGTEEDND
jgi:CII-binding regulator of phage lambda lysogenization HflD